MYVLAFTLLLAATGGPSEVDARCESRLGVRLCVNPDMSSKSRRPSSPISRALTAL